MFVFNKSIAHSFLQKYISIHFLLMMRKISLARKLIKKIQNRRGDGALILKFLSFFKVKKDLKARDIKKKFSIKI